MDFFFIDQITKFLRKNQFKETLETINLFQFYLKRVGLGVSISKKITRYCGVHSSIKIKNYSQSIFNKNLKNIFIESIEFLDDYVFNKMINDLRYDIQLYNYRGSRYKEKLPLNGQRRRANAKTIRKVRNIEEKK